MLGMDNSPIAPFGTVACLGGTLDGLDFGLGGGWVGAALNVGAGADVFLALACIELVGIASCSIHLLGFLVLLSLFSGTMLFNGGTFGL